MLTRAYLSEHPCKGHINPTHISWDAAIAWTHLLLPIWHPSGMAINTHIFQPMHLHPHECEIGNSSCVHAAVVSQLACMGLSVRGWMKHLCTPMRANTTLTQVYTAVCQCEQELRYIGICNYNLLIYFLVSRVSSLAYSIKPYYSISITDALIMAKEDEKNGCHCMSQTSFS